MTATLRRRAATRGRGPTAPFITLANIRAALEQNRHLVTIAPEIAGHARLAVERMLTYEHGRPLQLMMQGNKTADNAFTLH